MPVFQLDEGDYRQRVDVLLTKKVPELSRGFIKKLAVQNKIIINGEAVNSGYKIKQGITELTLDYDVAELLQIPVVELDIIYEDDDILAINKPTGLITHARGKYWNEASVASSIRKYQKDQDDADLRAGIVHRLDRATSGVIVCAKNREAHANLQLQFSERTAHKTYRALVPIIDLPDKGSIDKPISRNPKKPVTFMVEPYGKDAQTDFEKIGIVGEHLALNLYPKTGRTHQLRVHLASINAPIVGDGLYGGLEADRLMLHAYKLTINHPKSGEGLTLTADIPSIMEVK